MFARTPSWLSSAHAPLSPHAADRCGCALMEGGRVRREGKGIRLALEFRDDFRALLSLLAIPNLLACNRHLHSRRSCRHCGNSITSLIAE